MKLIVHAPNVHVGGGLILLKSLIDAADPHDVAFLSLDGRVGEKILIPSGMPFRRFNASPAGRLAAELELRKRADSASVVLCFGALPPIFRLAAYVVLFAQNPSILGFEALKRFGFRVGTRIAVERFWFNAFSSNVDEYIAQTPSIAAKLKERVASRQSVRILSFLDKHRSVPRRHQPATGTTASARYDFVYVASGIAHKNHRRLVLAWRVLANEGLFPSLCLTLDTDRDAALCSWISGQAATFGLKIDNAGYIEHSAVLDLYRWSRALIFPSTMESLGLPLIEARQAGLPIIASELDIVRDTVDPEESFDPTSEISIARAVKRFLGKEEKASSFMGPREFIAELLSRATR